MTWRRLLFAVVGVLGCALPAQAAPSLSFVSSYRVEIDDQAFVRHVDTRFNVDGPVSASLGLAGAEAVAFTHAPLSVGVLAAVTKAVTQAHTFALVKEDYVFTPAAPALIGQPGTLAMNWGVTGTVANTPFDENGEPVGGSGAGLFYGYFASTTLQESFSERLFGAATFPFDVHFLWGQKVTLTLQIGADANTANRDFPQSADFSHTVRVGSFEFRDQFGNPVTDVTVDAGSGVNPFVTDTTAVPEPGSLTLFGIGVVGLLGYARHRRKSVSRAP